MNKKKRITFIMIIFLPILLAIYMGIVKLGSDHSYEEGTLDVVLTWGDESEQIQKFFDPYVQSHGQSVIVDTRLREDDVIKVLSSDVPPDIVILSDTELIETLFDMSLIQPLDEIIQTTEIDLADYYPALLTQCLGRDKSQLCLPWGGDIQALFWNKDLFAAAGLDPDSPPQTMEELLDFSNKLTAMDPDLGSIKQIGFLPDFPHSHLDLYTRMFEGSWVSEDGSSISVASAPVIDALNWERSFFDPYDPEVVSDFVADVNFYRNSNHPTFVGRKMSCQQCHRTEPGNSEKMPDRAFYNQQIAIMIDGQWQIGPLYLPYFGSNLNYGLAPIPAPAAHPNTANTTLIQGPVIVIPSGSPDRAAALDLLSWLMSPEILSDAALTFGFLPPSQPAAADSRFQEVPYFEEFMDILKNQNTSYVSSAIISHDLNIDLVKAEKDILYKGTDVEESLMDIQTKYSSPQE
jgi:ABC-type glycerol-3-phosphate transport system substrate-binding protein